MDLMTVSEVSKEFEISTRMLRHYEQLGLLTSLRREDYAYRVYDEEAVRRLQQIIILRKLRIPLKQIARIFEENGQSCMADIFEQKIGELDIEMRALHTIRDVLRGFVLWIHETVRAGQEVDLLRNADVIRLVESLTLSKFSFQEEWSMDILNKANEILGKLKNVRIVQLPPYTVASYHVIGVSPEETAGEQMNRFVQESGLYESKPDARMFGFNHPSPQPGHQQHGYEDWITIPEDMEVPAPLVKKQFPGGLYAAHTITFGDFHEWELLRRWVEESDKYTPDYSRQSAEMMGGCLEEHLNWVYASHMKWPENCIDGQLDLLLPIRRK